jgi:ankyrin repeat protein
MRTATACALVAVLSTACSPRGSTFTLLARAARAGDVAAINALVTAGQDPNAPDAGDNRWTPLLHAIHKGQRASVEALLARGADANRRAPGGATPLTMAVGNGQADIVARLLEAGADPHQDGAGLLASAVAGGAFTDIENPLLGRCNTEVVRALKSRAPDLRLPPGFRGRLALFFARLNDCDDVIRLAG